MAQAALARLARRRRVKALTLDAVRKGTL